MTSAPLSAREREIESQNDVRTRLATTTSPEASPDLLVYFAF